MHAGVLAQGVEDLLKVFLQYIQNCCSRCDPCIGIHLLGPEIADLLEVSKVVRPEVRHGALSAIYAAMAAAMQYNGQVYSQISYEGKCNVT